MTEITEAQVEAAAKAIAQVDLPGWTWEQNVASGVAKEYLAMARAALEAVEAAEAPQLPLDPEPWLVRSIDSGQVRSARFENAWTGYHANFVPRKGYEQTYLPYVRSGQA